MKVLSVVSVPFVLDSDLLRCHFFARSVKTWWPECRGAGGGAYIIYIMYKMLHASHALHVAVHTPMRAISDD